MDQFIRTKMIYGEEAMLQLQKSHVAIFGVGGVGGYVAESLARTGVFHFTLIDNDVVSLSNINRQIIADTTTIGRPKVEVMKERILAINPNANVETKNLFFLGDKDEDIDFEAFDYIVDAIDTVKAKIALAIKANEFNVPIISSMGAGNKVDPMGFVVTDISKTEMDPLAKVIRVELRKRGVRHLKVVYSKERPVEPIKYYLDNEETNTKRSVPGSNAFVPTACGLLIASEVVRDLTERVARDALKRER